ncbi:MAG: NYN domain-containing protein [Chitinophagaceae bacterium]
MPKKTDLIALLVDGDNAQAKLLKPIIEEVSKYGKVTIRRIYGDWTSPGMGSWKKTLNDVSFTPIQKFSYTVGKNSTDSSLIIDAMDILHAGTVDGFCIVSSDSDYTGLAKRIREEGIFVMGIGEKRTPTAFVQSCEIFTFCETIAPAPEPAPKQTTKIKTTAKPQRPIFAKIDQDIINKAYDASSNEQEEAYISTLGFHIRRLDPSFDARAFGYKTLTQLMASLPEYELLYKEVNGDQQRIVRKRKSGAA